MTDHRRYRLFQAALGAGLFALLVAFAGPAAADDDDDDDVTIVYPTGVPDRDVANVQGAVDGGGVVLLKASDRDGNPRAFNFGQVFPADLQDAFDARKDNSVNIRNSVRIRGEELDDDWPWDDDDDDGDRDDEARTTIEGGLEPLRVLADGIDVIIEGIDFTCTRYKVIQVIAGNRVVIRNNRFGKVTFFKTDLDVVGAPRTFGVAVVTDTGAEQITLGTVVIEANEFDLNPDPSPECPLPADAPDPDPGRDELGDKFSVGIFAGNVDARMLIRNNHVKNTARSAIDFVDALGTVFVSNNIVEPGPTVFRASPDFLGSTGIVFENGFFNLAESEGTRYFVKKNNVTCANPNCRGIAVENFFFERGRAFVTRNHVNMDVNDTPLLPFASAINFAISDSVIAFNIIKGRSNFAVLLQDTIGFGLFDLADNNRVVGNKVKNFAPFDPPPDMDFFGFPWPQAVDYALFGASENFLRGRSGTVLDLGEDNVIRGGLEVID